MTSHKCFGSAIHCDCITANSWYNMMDFWSSPFPSNIVSLIRACLLGACAVDVASALFCALPPKKEAVPRTANFSRWSFLLLCLSDTNVEIASYLSFSNQTGAAIFAVVRVSRANVFLFQAPCTCPLVVEILASLALACQMYYHLCQMPCPATILLGIAAVLARKQGTPTTTHGTREGKTRSDGTTSLWRACWACRNL